MCFKYLSYLTVLGLHRDSLFTRGGMLILSIRLSSDKIGSPLLLFFMSNKILETCIYVLSKQLTDRQKQM